MKITGELLKAERLKKELTTQDVAYALKISSRIVQAIEAGQMDELPAKTFVRGFVKSYADYLKIDTEAVLKQFHEEMGSTHPTPKSGPNTSATFEAESKAGKNTKKSVFSNHPETLKGSSLEGGLTKKNIFYFGIVTSLLILIVIVNKITTHYQNEIPAAEADLTTAKAPSLQVVAPPSGTSVAAIESVPGETTTAQKEPTVSSTLNSSTETSVASETKTTATPNVSPTVAVPIETKPAVAASAEPVKTTEAIKTEKSNGQPVELLIEVKKDSFIDYAKGNTTDFKRLTLKANTYQILKSTSGLHLKASDGSAINLTVNGINKGPMSSSNKSVEITF